MERDVSEVAAGNSNSYARDLCRAAEVCLPPRVRRFAGVIDTRVGLAIGPLYNVRGLVLDVLHAVAGGGAGGEVVGERRVALFEVVG